MRKQVGDGRLSGALVCAGKEDSGSRGAEFMNGLAAGSAGRRGGTVEIDDDDCLETDSRTVQSDGSRDGGLLGAGGEAKRRIFHVASCDDGVVRNGVTGAGVGGKQDCSSDTEVAVRCMGVVGYSFGPSSENGKLVCGKVRTLSGLRRVNQHDR